jgi:hypothetical protein
MRILGETLYSEERSECIEGKASLEGTNIHQQKGTLLAMPYRIATLQMPYHINSKYLQGD